eukprot:1497332-Lingulodinium_polyedra.AAC.1
MAREWMGTAPQRASKRRRPSATRPSWSSRGASRSTLASPPQTACPSSGGISSSWCGAGSCWAGGR